MRGRHHQRQTWWSVQRFLRVSTILHRSQCTQLSAPIHSCWSPSSTRLLKLPRRTRQQTATEESIFPFPTCPSPAQRIFPDRRDTTPAVFSAVSVLCWCQYDAPCLSFPWSSLHWFWWISSDYRMPLIWSILLPAPACKRLWPFPSRTKPWPPVSVQHYTPSQHRNNSLGTSRQFPWRRDTSSGTLQPFWALVRDIIWRGNIHAGECRPMNCKNVSNDVNLWLCCSFAASIKLSSEFLSC